MTDNPKVSDMTIRDYFAAQLYPHLLRVIMSVDSAATHSYQLADELLAARELDKIRSDIKLYGQTVSAQ